jgi:serine/threonine protein kinase
LAQTIQGKQYNWRLSDKPIGSGDAGEVYAVTCTEQPELVGVMKKPARIATGGTIQRQAGQIAREGLALARLEGLPKCKAHPPQLVDQAPDFTQGTANFFIVSETAVGEDLSTMLIQSRQTGKPFPRRVIITVLDALFDLFARAHRVGVLWNDVKLEHIYWHNSTGGVSVIDWGNAQFLSEPNEQRRVLPRWEDYRQMVDTLGGFLLQTAPELYEDLGWSEFQGEELDLLKISILARRIAYQQEVIALRVMEYQSLIRVVLSSDPSLTGLQDIQSYQKILEQIGAPWESTAVLEYGKKLVEQLIDSGDNQSAIRATTIIWDLFDNNLDLSWHLLREYFRNTDILSHPSLGKLTRETLNETWSQVLWTLVSIARELQSVGWWDQLIPVLRQKSLGLISPPPIQICQSILEWQEAKTEKDQANSEKLRQILQEWRIRGEDLKESPFDYELLDLVHEYEDLPRKLNQELKRGFAAGEEAIRELLQVWVNMNWDAIQKAFRRLIGWDPDRWGVLRLDEAVIEFQSWLYRLYQGPPAGEEISTYLSRMLDSRPPVEKLLGSPPWLHALLEMLDQIDRGVYLADYQAGIQTWCPWLLGLETIHDKESKLLTPDDSAINKVLEHFVQHLKNWTDLDAGVEGIRQIAPSYYSVCKHLMDGFQSIFHLNANLVEIIANCTEPQHQSLQESCETLQILGKWRQAVDEQNLDLALEILNESPKEKWRILKHAFKTTIAWNSQIQPLLKTICGHSIKNSSQISEDTTILLNTVKELCSEIHRKWNLLYKDGLHQQFLEAVEESTENARNDFFAWRNEMEHTTDPVTSLLYHSWLTRVRGISDQFLRLVQHVHQARISFSMLTNENEVPLAVQIRAADNLLDHLTALEAILVDEESERRFPEWHAIYRTISETSDVEKRRDLVLSADHNHPLYAWLVQSVLAKT